MGDLLKKLERKLKNAKLDPAEAGSVPHLVIPLDGVDLVISQVSDAQKSAGEQQQPADPEIDYLQFFARLPYQIHPAQMGHVSAFMGYINARLPLVGFVVTADQKSPAYRYMMLVNPEQESTKLVGEAVEGISYAVRTFGELFRNLSTGEMEFPEAVQEANI
jgi:hypothetical protein